MLRTLHRVSWNRGRWTHQTLRERESPIVSQHFYESCPAARLKQVEAKHTEGCVHIIVDWLPMVLKEYCASRDYKETTSRDICATQTSFRMSAVDVFEPISQTTERLHFCSLCKKPFSQETSCARHIKYCRRRASQQRQSRPQACHTCRLAKTKCDFKDPCSRCARKQLACSYGGKVAPIHDSRPGQIERVPSHGTLSPAHPESDSVTGLGRSENAPLFSLDELADIDLFDSFSAVYPPLGDFQRGSTPRKDLSLPHIFVNEAGRGINPFEPSSASTLASSSPHSLLSQTPLSLAVPITSTITQPTRPPTFLSNGTRNFLLSIINSYPRMLAQGTILPPFIHPLGSRLHFDGRPSDAHTINPDCSNTATTQLLEPLETLTTIARLFHSHPPSNTDFLWRTISTESAQIDSTLRTLSLGSTLAALQSTMLYGTMRVLLSGRSYAAINAGIVRSMEKLAARCVALTGAAFSVRHRKAGGGGGRPSWEEWICEETRRRVSVVCFITALTIGAQADDPIVNPNNHVLPSSKALWEARTREEWEDLYEGQYTSDDRPRLETVGDLVIAKLGRGSRNEGRAGRGAVDEMVGQWYAEMDGLGMMLAAVVASF
ncbi:hypothetical protein DPSP01_012663 [Paraphaeosphaeria sporulosa]